VSERPRAVVVVTGSELVRGERTDRTALPRGRGADATGLEPARITIVGDAPAELEAAFREGWKRTRVSYPAVSGRRTTIARWS
jgi:molybdopterin-biosynthesis enzyme MoeA-like protein